jgi:hypothetical protein
MFNRLSWQRLLLNAIAFWLIYNGFGTLSFLNELQLAELARHHANLGKELANDGTTMTVGKMFIGVAIASIVGLLFAFFISLVASVRRRWHWLNAVLGLVLVVLLIRYLPLNRDYLLKLPGSQFAGAWYYWVYGFIMVVTGIVLLWLKKKVSRHTDNTITPNPKYA